MSIYSDYKCGALTDDEFRFLCNEENRRDRYEREHMFDDIYDPKDEGEEDDEPDGDIY